MIPVMVSAAAFVSIGVLHRIWYAARRAATLLMTMLLVVLTGMLLVLVAAAGAAEPAGVLILIRHDSRSS